MAVLRIASRDLFVVDLDSEIQLTWPEFSRIFSRESSKSWVLRGGALAQMGGGAGGASAWGDITGTLSSQTDLNSALGGKVATNDSRLSDARTPLTHSHAPADVTGTAVITNDARLSDARTPLAHSHAETDVTNLVTDLGNKQATLVSSTNIKTINSNSILGAGNLAVSSSNPWDGLLVHCCGNGNPGDGLVAMMTSGVVSPTPTNITVSIARIAYFRLPAGIVVNKIRFFGVGATTNVYRVAIYNGDTLARLTAELAFSTAANTWGAIGSALNLTLAAGQLYFAAVAVNTTGTTPGVLSCGTTVAATTGLIGVLPKSWPGNLDIDLAPIQGTAFAQFAVTSGALPATAATIAAQSAWTGGMPAFFLDNNNA